MPLPKLELPKGRERALPAHPRYFPEDAWTTMRMVHFSDCDPAGSLTMPRFVDMAGGVVEEFFQARLRINFRDLIEIERITLGHKSADCDVFKPALMGDRLQFTILVEHIGRTSLIFSIHCVREIEEIMRCRLVMVTASVNTHSAITIPRAVKDALTSYKDNCR
jgi:4-hydroxybenzoyl-CoA thioesterase